VRVIANLRRPDVLEMAAAEVADLDAARLYRDHAGFVWASLQRMGVREPDLEDVLQDTTGRTGPQPEVQREPRQNRGCRSLRRSGLQPVSSRHYGREPEVVMGTQVPRA
jgi:hypothetical protein